MKATQVLIYFSLISAAIESIAAYSPGSSQGRVPKLTFFCEVDPINIPLLSDQEVINVLIALNASVRYEISKMK